MTDAIERTNDAHRVLTGRRTVRDELKRNLDKCHEELAQIDEHARKNHGQVPHPPVCRRPAVEVLHDKAVTEVALADAERRVKEAKEVFDRLQAEEDAQARSRS